MRYVSFRNKVLEAGYATEKEIRKFVWRLALTAIGVCGISVTAIGFFVNRWVAYLTCLVECALFFSLMGYASEDEGAFKGVGKACRLWILLPVIWVAVILVIKFAFGI